MKLTNVLIFSVLMATGNIIAQVIIDDPNAPQGYVVGLDEQDEQKMLGKLPSDVRADLLKIKTLDPEKYKEMLFNASHLNDFYIQDVFEKKRMENYKRIEQLEIQTKSLGIQYQHADTKEKANIKKNLKAKLAQLFDLKEEGRRMEVEMFEKELIKLRESLDVRKKNKDDIILRRLSELIGNDDYMDW